MKLNANTDTYNQPGFVLMDKLVLLCKPFQSFIVHKDVAFFSPWIFTGATQDHQKENNLIIYFPNLFSQAVFLQPPKQRFADYGPQPRFHVLIFTHCFNIYMSGKREDEIHCRNIISGLEMKTLIKRWFRGNSGVKLPGHRQRSVSK